MTRQRSVVLAGALAIAAGCGGQPKPPARPASPVSAPAPASAVKSQPEAPVAAAEWAYTSIGKRDPFRSFLAEVQTTGAAAATRCLTPLGRFEIDQLRLVAVVTGLDDPVAMLEAPNNVGYSVRRGACIGRNGGVVAAVRSGEVVVSEWVVRADGTRDRSQTVLRLPREASLNIEE